MASTFRSDVRAALYQQLVTFNAAQSALNEVYASRPKNFPNPPCAYVGRASEVTPHMSGIRQRRINVPLVLVGWPVDNEEQQDTLDDLTDALLDQLTANWSAIPFALITPTGVEPIEVSVGEATTHAAEAINVLCEIQEGRT